MKFFSLFVVFGTILMTQVANAQKYERVYAESTTEIRQRIDQNKIGAAPMLSGISTHHVAGVSGLSASQVAGLQAELSADTRVTAVTVSPDGTSVVIDSQADFAKEELAQILAHFNAAIIGYAATYSLSEE